MALAILIKVYFIKKIPIRLGTPLTGGPLSVSADGAANTEDEAEVGGAENEPPGTSSCRLSYQCPITFRHSAYSKLRATPAMMCDIPTGVHLRHHRMANSIWLDPWTFNPWPVLEGSGLCGSKAVIRTHIMMHEDMMILHLALGTDKD